jgi:nucleotide-binding universal stress UspA family protein
MISFKKVICATDFSDSSFRALDYARMLTERFEADLLLVHVVDDPPTAVPPVGGAAVDSTINVTEYQEHLVEHATRRLAELVAEQDSAGPSVRSHVAKGRPSRQIVQLAAAEEADLIVIGTHGHNRLHRLVFGSVTEKVVRAAPCPVLTVGLEENDESG